MITLVGSGVVHRDLAARNVLLDEKFFAKVSDFGSSQRRSVDFDVEAASSADKLGPYKWQSIESLRDKTFSEKSDVWSFGCILIELLTRREPYDEFNGTVLDLVSQIRDGSIDPLRHAVQKRQLPDSAPTWATAVLKTCFLASAADRPSFREVRYQLGKSARELLNQYESELDEADSVLNESLYQPVPSGASTGSATLWSPSVAPTPVRGDGEKPSESSGSSIGSISSSDVERLNKLGQGSYGAVYLGTFQGQYVALKVLTINQNSAAEIKREAEIMRSIAPHRNIVKLHGLVTEASSELMIVMELAPKGALSEYISTSKSSGSPITEALLFKWALGTARGMAHLSGSKIIHRDLSARNVLLDSSLEPKIADFGLGRSVLDPNQETSTQSDVGPLRWFAPECFELKYSEKTDVWAFGCTLVELVTGDIPFAEISSAIDVAIAVRDESRNALESIAKKKDVTLPDWLKDTIAACFARDAKDRPAFAELVTRLEQTASSIKEINDAEELIRKRRERRGQSVVQRGSHQVSGIK